MNDNKYRVIISDLYIFFNYCEHLLITTRIIEAWLKFPPSE